jgi:replicative DNA helicase Mcm
MNVEEQVKRFQDFLEKEYKAKLAEKIRKGEYFLDIDFSKLTRFDIDLAEATLEEPEELIEAFELAIKQFNFGESIKNFKIRLSNLPESQKIMINEIRSAHLNKLFVVEGVVRQKSDVRPQVISAKFECPQCGNIISVLQLESVFKEPSKCGCGRKGKFRLINKEMVDAQGMVLEEAPENLKGGVQPKRMNVLLKDELVSPLSDIKSAPGSKVIIIGLVKEVPITSKSGGKLTRFDLIIEANNLGTSSESFYEVNITKEEEEKIKELSKDINLYPKLVKSMIPSIFGYETIKEALLLQLMGGLRKVRKDKVVSRGDIHILLVGDPGAGKSAMVKRIQHIAPKGRYVAGKGVSGAGLTASVVKDEFLRGFAVEAGAMVLASDGICCTTGDSEFITENYKKIRFDELFKDEKEKLVYPKFKILALNTKTNKIEPFKIKKAFKIKNNKKIYSIKTRTGRELKLTKDNEVLICINSQNKWIPIEKIKKGNYIAVPKNYTIDKTDNISENFAYICGLIASDGSITINNRRAQTSFYNTDLELLEIYKNKLKTLNIKFNINIQKKGRKSKIRGKEFVSKKDLHNVYNSQKSFAKKIIDFGIPSGNKSTKFALNKKIISYSNKTLSAFMKGVFDGDGSIRYNPTEVTITTGIKQNALLFQEILQRFNLISSVKKSTNSWHCDIRGANECKNFLNLIGSFHPLKFDKLCKIKSQEIKDRIDILPNHQNLFKKIIKENRWKLGKNIYKYIWNYSRNGVSPSKIKLKELNMLIKNNILSQKIDEDILWDQIISIKKENAKYVYDFVMQGTNNFIANNIIMHNCIDEMDKMTEDDRAAMHEAMENQTVSISKANVQATLIARTTVLAAANPKFGRFDPYEILGNQINLPPALINRFDLIFPIKDLPDEARDLKLAEHMLSLHQNPKSLEEEIPTDLLRKYIAYAKQNIHPHLTDSAFDEIKNYYVKMRKAGSSEESSIKSVPISPRQLDALVRMSEASAKVRLSDKVTKKDAQRAVKLLEYCLNQVGFDKETGKIDIDRITTGISSSERSHIHVIKDIINELENKIGKTIPIEDITEAAKNKGIDPEQVDEIIEKLKRSGDIFEPKHGFLSKI